MAYRNPRFIAHHALRATALADWNSSGFDPGFEQEKLRDDHLRLLARFTGTSGPVWVSADQGPDWASKPVLNRWIVPSGHNLGGETVTIRQSATPITGAGQGSIADQYAVPAGSELISRDSFSIAPISNRYVSFETTISDASQKELGELWLSETLETQRGPVFSWQDNVEATQVEVELRSGQIQRLEVGSARRVFIFEYQALEGADLQVFRDLRSLTNNGLFPLWVDPPDDTEDAVLCDLTEGVPLRQDFPDPKSGITSYTSRITLIEHTG